LYEWVVDSDDVPHVLVDATTDGVVVPTEHVDDGKIVLNLGPNAVRDLVLEQDYVMCNSRFGGRDFEIYLPMASIRAIYGRDSRQGMVFPDEDAPASGDAPDGESDGPGSDDGPSLKLV